MATQSINHLICGDSVYKPLEIIFRQAVLSGVFPSKRKKRKHCSCSQKRNKQNIENYRPVSVLPICGKIFERLIFNERLRIFISNNFISPNQSGFKPRDLCINQLLPITQKTDKSFDDRLEVRGVFRYI